jgi:hypothetical protein
MLTDEALCAGKLFVYKPVSVEVEERFLENSADAGARPKRPARAEIYLHRSVF